jgi:hypothetical protein
VDLAMIELDRLAWQTQSSLRGGSPASSDGFGLPKFTPTADFIQAVEYIDEAAKLSGPE